MDRKWTVRRNRLAVAGIMAVCTAFALASLAGYAAAQPTNWTPLAPGGGGRCYGVYPHPTNPNIVWVNTDVSGLFESTDGGTTFTMKSQPMNLASGSGDVFFGNCCEFAIDPTHTNDCYFCSRTTGVNRVAHGDGLWKSADGGTTWTVLSNNAAAFQTYGPNNNSGAASIAFGWDGTFYVALYNSNVLWVSTNQGSSFTTYTLPFTTPNGNDENLCMAAAQLSGGVSTMYISNPISGSTGLYYTTNQGATWTAVSALSGVTVGAIACSPVSGSKEVVAVTSTGKIYISIDGTTFTLNSETLTVSGYNGDSSRVGVGISSTGRICAWGNNMNVPIISDNNGSSWTNSGITVVDNDFLFPWGASTSEVIGFAGSPCSGQFYKGSGSCIQQSLNNGINWSVRCKGIEVLCLCTAPVVDADNTSAVYSMAADMGYYRTTNLGTTWATSPSLGNTFVGGGSMAQDPNTHTTMYAIWGNQDSNSVPFYSYKSTDRGVTWTQYATQNVGNRYRESASMVVDPTDSNRLYFSTSIGGTHSPALTTAQEEVQESTDGGKTFNGMTGSPLGLRGLKVMSNGNLYGVTSAWGGYVWKYTKSSGAWTEIYAVQGAMGFDVDPTETYILVADEWNGALKLSKNGGSSFSSLKDWNNHAITAWSCYIDPVSPGIMLASCSNINGGASGVIISTNHGSTWSPLTSANAPPFTVGFVYGGIPGRVYAWSGAMDIWRVDQLYTTLAVQSTPPTGLTIGSSTGDGGVSNYTVSGVTYGASVNLQAPATDPAGYTFVQWTVNGTAQTAGQKALTFAIAGATTAVAQYATTTNTLTVNSLPPTALTIGSSTGHGGVSNYTIPGITYGASVNLQAPATDPTGYTFLEWTVNGTAQTSGQKSITFAMDGAVTAVAQYTVNAYALTVHSTPETGVAVTSSSADGGTTNYTVSSVSYGTSVNLQAPATDPTGYTFSQWTVNGAAQTSGQKSITFAMNSATTAIAQYTANTYGLTVNSTGPTGVVITSSGADGGTTNYTVSAVAYGTSVNLQAPATDPTGYTFSKWTVNGAAQASGLKSITFAMPGTTTAVAQYTVNSYTLTVQSTPPAGIVIGSSATYGGTTSYSVPGVAYNTSVNLQAPATDSTGAYAFAQWTVNGAAQASGQQSITFAMAAAATTAVAQYTPAYTLTVQSTLPTGLSIGSSSGDDGTTNYQVNSVAQGASVNLQAPATDPAGYTFTQWTVNGAAQTPGQKSVTFTMTAATTAVAQYQYHGVLYVNQNATGANTGLSWTDAYVLLQSALNAAVSGNQIWVAAGTYAPTSDYGLGIGAQGNHFELQNGVAIYGGFAGTETLLSQRNWQTNVTILSGQGSGCHVFYNDNTYNGLSLDNTAVLDGFTITGGNANAGSPPHNCGGGMYNGSCSPAIANCTFSSNAAANYGGGVYNNSCSPAFTNCAFTGNSATTGGGMNNDAGSSPMVTNCLFSGNSASNYGGGMSITGGSPSITNCTFSGNLATVQGGGMYNNSTATVINCVLWGDSAGAAAEIFNSTLAATLSCSDIAGSGGSGSGWIVSTGTDGGGNIAADPVFVSPVSANLAPTTTGNYSLHFGSPCIDAGNTAAVPAGVTTDLAGNPRVVGTAVDIGAYEVQEVIYVNQSATGANNGTSWANAYVLLQSALSAAVSGNQIWVAAGTYAPTSDYGLGIGAQGNHFELQNGVAIYGGFAGTETLLSGRDWQTNITTLSGQGSSYHVFYNDNAYNGLSLNTTAVLDGFTITGGNANAGSPPHSRGGGMYNNSCSPAIANCTFSGDSAGDHGGGMFNLGASPTVTNCTFSSNSAVNYGGGVYNNSCSPAFTNCAFTGNSATTGGGMNNDAGSSSTVTNCLFSGNSASNDGGGLCNSGGSPSITNCTFSGNLAAVQGGGMYNNSTAIVINCVLWGDSAGAGAEIYNYTFSAALSYSDIAGSGGSGSGWISSTGTDGGGNIAADPLFVSPVVASAAPTVAGDYHLSAGSPCINSAEGSVNAFVVAATDKDGNPRHDDTGMPVTGIGTPDYVDMGAYEFQGTTCFVTVQSTTPTGLSIASSTGQAGTTDYTSPAAQGASVTLQAPDADPAGYVFSQWTVNGTGQTLGQKSITFTITADATAVALYAPLYALTVQSTPPAAVVIGSSTTDGGTTNYTIPGVAQGASVNLQASTIDPAGYTFSQWTVNGTGQTLGQKSIMFTMSAATLAVAQYTLNSYTLTVQSTPPAGVVIGSSTADSGTANYNVPGIAYGTSVNLQAPATDPTGYTFAQWLVNGAGQTLLQKSVTFTMSAATSAVAQYTANTYALNVQSTPPTGVVIGSSTISGGTTPYSLPSVAYGASVNLQAPTTDSTGTYTFSQWVLNGAAQTWGQTSVTFTMPAVMTAVAQYRTDITPPKVSNQLPAPGGWTCNRLAPIELDLKDSGAALNLSTVVITASRDDGTTPYTIFNGSSTATDAAGATYYDASSNAVFPGKTYMCNPAALPGSNKNYMFVFEPSAPYDFDETVTVTVNATDDAGNSIVIPAAPYALPLSTAAGSNPYSFTVASRSFGPSVRVDGGIAGNACSVTATDGNGNVWVAWERTGATGKGAIWVAERSNDGWSFGPEIQVTNSGDCHKPAIAIHKASGTIYVAYEVRDSVPPEIGVMAAPSSITSATASLWSSVSPVTMTGAAVTLETAPAIKVDSTDTYLYVAGVGPDANSVQQVGVGVGTLSGGTATWTVTEITGNAILGQTGPAIAKDADAIDDTVYIAWVNPADNNLYGVDSGNWTATPHQLTNNSSPAVSSSPAISTEDGGGNVLHFVWRETGTTVYPDIQHAKGPTTGGWPTSGTYLTGVSVLDTGTGTGARGANYPRVAVSGSTASGTAKAFVVWQDSRTTSVAAGDTSIMFAETKCDGTFGTNIYVTPLIRAEQTNPALGLSADGIPHIAWTDLREAGASHIYFADAMNPCLFGSQASTPEEVMPGTPPPVTPGWAILTDPANPHFTEVDLLVPADTFSTPLNIVASELRNPILECAGGSGIFADGSGLYIDITGAVEGADVLSDWVTVTIHLTPGIQVQMPSPWAVYRLVPPTSSSGSWTWTPANALIQNLTYTPGTGGNGGTLSFQTMHLSTFGVGSLTAENSGSGGASVTSSSGGGGGGGCSMSPGGETDVLILVLPLVMLGVWTGTRLIRRKRSSSN